MRQRPVACDFCGKTHDEARSTGWGGLVAGYGSAAPGTHPGDTGLPPDAYICGECAALVVDILEGDKAAGN